MQTQLVFGANWRLNPRKAKSPNRNGCSIREVISRFTLLRLDTIRCITLYCAADSKGNISMTLL